MTLHDRIMGLIPDDITNGGEEFYDGFAEASKKAAQLATEADELMAEMAEALNKCRGVDQSEAIDADYAYTKYLAYMERNNEQ